MSRDAFLPCFKCGKALQNAFIESDNQPSEGTEFRTQGHYGSTFWDSFDGVDLVLNVCDRCLREHSDRLGQQKVFLPIRCAGMTGFGHVEVNRFMVAYTGNEDKDSVSVDIEDLGDSEAVGVTYDCARVRWVGDIAERQAELLKEYADES